MTSKKVAKKKTGTQLAKNWKQDLKKFAKEEEAQIVSGEGLGFISIQTGDFMYRGDALGEPLELIILDHCFENSYFPGAFDPDNPELPDCFSIGRINSELIPGEAGPDIQSETCIECPQNEWGSAEVGRGKACKNCIRLLVTPADKMDPQTLLENEVALLRLAPTSLKFFNGFVRKVNRTRELPTFGVVASLTLEKGDEKLGYKTVIFEYAGDVPDACGPAIMQLREENEDLLLAEYTPSQYEAQEEKNKQARKASKKKRKVKKKVAKKKTKKKTARKRF